MLTGASADSLTYWTSQPCSREIALPLVPMGKKIGLARPGRHTLRHSYRSMLDVCGAPIAVQQKLMWHDQVSTTMRYRNAYMTEK